MAAVPPAQPWQFTRCPDCRTLFRVTSEQLALRAGQVRCGQCKTVFDANAQIVSRGLAPRTDVGEHDGEAALGSRTVTLRDTYALETPVAAVPAAPSIIPRISPPDGTATNIAYGERFARTRRQPSSRALAVVYAAAILLLVLLLAAQALFHFSSAIAAHWPGTAPALARLCETAGCAVRPLSDARMQYLAIDASDLQADPAHKGLLTLTATIRNRAGWTLAYPHLELTLTDAQDQVVVRRALAPSDYASGTVELANGIAANGEIAIKLFIDASATVQAGYRLYMFYP
jgi:predicted Zn finger-like uncharacterized protein